ncbi:MAG: hypothetical protein F7C35_02925 [Desulfurococcales archaeon]|nr:hypothetical protein [Desulfurococcales archaeon]
MVWIDYERAERFGKLLGAHLRGASIDGFTDPRYYPPPTSSRETIAMYFLVMVALDHRLSRPGRPYEGLVEGEFFHGADLLYRLGRKILDEDPKFFTAERLSKITAKDIELLFSAPKPEGGIAKPPDPHVRASLLRDLGIKLSKLFDGLAYKIIVESGGFLRKGVGKGFIDLLKVFTAYQDPVEKKPFLLAKFLERRGVLPIADPQNKEVPVDNHLARIAVRTGIVRVDGELLEKIAAGIPFTPEEDVIVRYAARIAYKVASAAGGVDPFVMDDLLWQFGRKCCTRDAPTCKAGCSEGCRRIGGCAGDSCIFAPICRAVREPLYMVSEHRFIDTWWY